MKNKAHGKRVRINILMDYLEMLIELVKLAIGEDKKKYQGRIDTIINRIEAEMELQEKPKGEIK